VPLPDRLGPGLRAVFVGINPSLRSASTAHHYAGPGNRFWPALRGAGLVPEDMGYERDHELVALGFGLTNVVARATRGASELTPRDHARGLVVERGGMLSHGAIVARDFGIPAVVMKNASRLIPDGSTVKVDGSKGRVEITK